MMTWTVHRDCRGKGGNQREHWSAKARRVAAERAATEGSALVQLKGVGMRELAKMPKPLLVKLVRIGKRYLDSDNVSNACAAVRDQVAVMLGVTDAWKDQRVTWDYGQELGEYGVRVEIRSAEELAS